MFQNQVGVKRDDVVAFDTVERGPVLLVLPTLVLDVAADTVEEVERTVRADNMEDWEGELLRRFVLPVIEGPEIVAEVSLLPTTSV